ncbi:UDP-N-acetylmuramate dehydrogenase [Butyrivibrio sp. MC2021]|uniref:UDP-N-acetylmuramate dehydrogenase n=1 Tax=Butyrivibrio sp. MC2021 TaxID=1408306 RepID=UPI00047CD8FB|nr:UDP-N-acetylmuramate dehydrogenase [Butyrivibrio sp. MC2021]
MKEELLESLRGILSEENILIDEPMSRHTTFKTGGPARLFIRPDNRQQLLEALDIIRKSGEQHYILGNGSNLLVSDKGYEGVIISLSNLKNLEVVDETRIRAEAGCLNSQIAALARENSLTGFEFAAGIPGTIGGAMIMNAGAYGGEMKMITESVTVLSPEGEIEIFSNEAMEFSYRTSAIKNKGYVVLEVILSLEKGDKDAIIATMNDLALKRKEKQPLEYPSAGSTFKRPEGYFAGKLIEDAGLRGYQVGGARVSDKHCGFVVNMGEATSADVYRLICDVKEKVLENSGVTLEPEVIMLGEF